MTSVNQNHEKQTLIETSKTKIVHWEEDKRKILILSRNNRQNKIDIGA